MERKRFLGAVLIALGEYLLKGKQPFDDLDFDIADIIPRSMDEGPLPTIPELIRELQKRRPNLSVDDDKKAKFEAKIKKRVRRLLKPIPPEYLEPLPPL